MCVNFINFLYLIASVCFIVALKGLSDAKTARNGNVIGIDCGLAKISVYEDKCRLGCLCLDDMTEIYV